MGLKGVLIENKIMKITQGFVIFASLENRKFLKGQHPLPTIFKGFLGGFSYHLL